MKILIVLTSHDQLGDTGEKTGFWIEEFAAPYYLFTDAGAEVVIASPRGGLPPVDPKSALPDFQTDATRRFDEDTELQSKLTRTLKLTDISADEFDAIFYPGGHGPLWDLTDNEDSIRLIETFWQQGKPVSAVCHASCVLLNARGLDGELLVKGRVVTGFSNTEEEAVALADVVPFLLEDELKQRGGDYSKVADWSVHCVTDGQLVTGQNPASSEAVAEAVVSLLK
ncbi:MAG: type 1 glutamine amidotransferase domain-containing protein [Endozoicomonas sp.]